MNEIEKDFLLRNGIITEEPDEPEPYLTNESLSEIYSIEPAHPSVAGVCTECEKFFVSDSTTQDLPDKHPAKNLKPEDGSFYQISFIKRTLKGRLMPDRMGGHIRFETSAIALICIDCSKKVNDTTNFWKRQKGDTKLTIEQQSESTKQPEPDRMLKYFAYKHLPERLQHVSRPFHDLAVEITETIPSCPERTVALRKLLESKDCAVRASLPEE